MRILIIEDELLAQVKLETMLKAIDPHIQVEARLSSVKASIAWLQENPSPDLAFVDIQLSDDHSFEIFRRFSVKFPVVFTTAFDKYLLESFEFNSIDYLLKPITEEKLKRSLSKVRQLEQHFLQGNIMKFITGANVQQSDRIVAKKGTDFITLTLRDVAYFYTEHKVVFARDFGGRQFIIDKSLGELEQTLDKHQFFRVNRKFLAQINAIEKFRPDHGRIRVFLIPEVKEEVHVSKETAREFRQWMGAER